MTQKMIFLNKDKLWYIATYTDSGDFINISEKGFETLEIANKEAGFPEGTPSGEIVRQEENTTTEKKNKTSADTTTTEKKNIKDKKTLKK